MRAVRTFTGSRRADSLAGLVLVAALMGVPAASAEDEPPEPEATPARNLNVLGGWVGFSDLRSSLYRFVTKQAYELLSLRSARVDGLRTLEQWREKQREAREGLLNAIGPFP